MEMYDFVVLDSASLRQLPITAEMLDIFKERIAAEGDSFFQTKEFDCHLSLFSQTIYITVALISFSKENSCNSCTI